MEKILFLDRDGVINVDKGYVSKIEDFEFVDGIFNLCLKHQNQGYKIVVITNQTGIGANFYSLDDFLIVNKYMLDEMEKRNIKINDVYYCPHDPDLNCECRKPKPKMILDALKKYNANPDLCILVGDKKTDIEAGYNANIKTLYFLKTNYEEPNVSYPYKIIKSLDNI